MYVYIGTQCPLLLLSLYHTAITTHTQFLSIYGTTQINIYQTTTNGVYVYTRQTMSPTPPSPLSTTTTITHTPNFYLSILSCEHISKNDTHTVCVACPNDQTQPIITTLSSRKDTQREREREREVRSQHIGNKRNAR
jgi:hypothetical protein